MVGEIIRHSKIRDGVEGADSGRNSETIETLQERSDEAAQCEPSGKRVPATQSNSTNFLYSLPSPISSVTKKKAAQWQLFLIHDEIQLEDQENDCDQQERSDHYAHGQFFSVHRLTLSVFSRVQWLSLYHTRLPRYLTIQ